MGRGGQGKQDPLVVKRDLTCVETNGNKYLCAFSGVGTRERVVEIAEVISVVGDRNSANFMARRQCEKGVRAFTGIDTNGVIYVAKELDANEAAAIADRILTERHSGGRGNQARREFAAQHGANGCGPEMTGTTEAVNHTRWAEDVALVYLGKPISTVRIDAVDQLPVLCGVDGQKRAALVIAFNTVAELAEGPKQADALRGVARELEAGTLHL